MPSVLIKLGAIGAAALRPFKKSAHGQGRENEKSLLYCVISLVAPPDIRRMNEVNARRARLVL